MPTYQYACTACDERLEAVQSFTDAPLTQCPTCDGTLRKVFSAVGVVFKGSGFYKNDSRGAGPKSDGGKSDGAKSDGAKSDGAATSDGAKAGGGTKADGGSGSGAPASAKSSNGKDTSSSSAAAPKTPAGKSA